MNQTRTGYDYSNSSMTHSPNEIFDELLVLKCQDGDETAFKTLVSRWHSRLRRHAWYLTQDWEAAGDIVQDVWLDIVRSIRRLKDPASFRSWSYRIVRNKANDWLRSKQRQRTLWKEMASQKQNDDKLTPQKENTVHTQSVIQQGIKALSTSSQQILSMKYMDHMSTQDISQALGIPEGTVKSRLHHAREQLKQVIQRNES
ncbi:MAG: RNA polymerase sigma factor [Planctomycetes bacterium]|nr:RNA polymerase sigma factor [Planctomycetota bacterium]MCH9726749.1 RNA polymerase sigma factor [Planctomycetota bacterium]MCH9776774.1 RNA polymerase sigma factor [Planctomycetota bacterium]MCH9789398.1 RNA polymerase sigma factor [Planctomycetota bacterium]